MSIKKIKWEPPFKAIGETDSLEHLREMLRFHGNARVNLMEDLKKIIMICRDYEFDLKIHDYCESTMGEYIDWSARDCDAECAAQVIQSSLEVSQSAQQATASVSEAILLLEHVSGIVSDIQNTYEGIEGQVIQLRIDTRKLSDDINLLKQYS